MKKEKTLIIVAILVFCCLVILQSCKKDTKLNIDSLYLS